MLKTCLHALNWLTFCVWFMMKYWIALAEEWLALLRCTCCHPWGVWALCDCCCRTWQGCAEGMLWDLCMVCPVNNRRMRLHNFLTVLATRRWWGLRCSPKGRCDFVRPILFGRIWEQTKKATCFPEDKERAEKVVGWGNVYERWPLSATFTSWLMLGVGVTYTNAASCMALHFADFNHSRVCLLQVVISFWSVSWDRSSLLESMQRRGKTYPYKNRTC